MTLYEKIYQQIAGIDPNAMSAEERAVMAILWAQFQAKTGVHVTQREIAKQERWLGCHPEHEADIVANEMETTLRQVRQVIRDLRINHSVPILSDRTGYWICMDEGEAREYITTLEREARAQAKAWFETYGAMNKIVGIESPFFEDMRKTVTQETLC